MMQRLYSTFPAALPGVGLLLLRAGAGVPLAISAFRCGNYGCEFLAAGEAAVACCLMLGYCTPVAAAIEGGSYLWSMFWYGSNELQPIMVVLNFALMLLGPGAFSVDARLYGRRRLNLPPSG